MLHLWMATGPCASGPRRVSTGIIRSQRGKPAAAAFQWQATQQAIQGHALKTLRRKEARSAACVPRRQPPIAHHLGLPGVHLEIGAVAFGRANLPIASAAIADSWWPPDFSLRHVMDARVAVRRRPARAEKGLTSDL